MNHRTAALASVLSGLIAVSLFPSAAEACGAPPAPPPVVPRAFSNLPADKAIAPRNTKLWVTEELDAQGQAVPVTLSVFTKTGSTDVPLTVESSGAALRVYTPGQMLESNTVYHVKFGGLVRSTFTTDDSIDSEPPAMPTLEVDATTLQPAGNSLAFSSYKVTSAASVSFLVEETGAAARLPSHPLAIAGSDTFTNVPTGRVLAHLSAVTFDLAGNAAVSPVVESDMRQPIDPELAYGCNAVPDVAALQGLLALLAAMSMRRRNQPRG